MRTATEGDTVFRFDHWAQPVQRRRWAVAAVVLHAVMRASRYRILGAASHRAWERACGITRPA